MSFYTIRKEYDFRGSKWEAYKMLTLLPGSVVYCGKEKAVSDTHSVGGGFHGTESSFL